MASCSECTYLDLEKEYESYDCKYWCTAKDEWHYANEAECWRFCRAYSRSISVANSFYKRSEESQKSSGGCYITTIVCEILGKNDNDNTLETLRKFRDNFLQKNRKYFGLLITYDIIGPIIAKKIREDENKEQIASNLYNLGIKKVAEYIDNNENEKAISLYTNMTQLLIDGYQIRKPAINKVIVNDIPTSQLGHGKQYVKKGI